MTRRLPWPGAQDAIVREHYLLPTPELWALVNAAGPKRSRGAVVTRRAALGVLKCPRPRGSALRIKAIAADVARRHRLTVDVLTGPRKDRAAFVARCQAMAEAYDTGGFSYITVGRFFGGRDHSTAYNAVKKARALAQQEAA